MNYTKRQEEIEKLIRSFKNAQFRINNISPSDLPSSNRKLSNDSMQKISDAIAIVPKYGEFMTPKKRIENESITKKCAICPNRHLQRITAVDSVGAEHVAVSLRATEDDFIDTRTLGGGLKEYYIEDSIGKNVFINSYADIGYMGGTPTPASVAFSVEVPADILTKFERSEIENVVSKYSAAGTHFALMFYQAGDVEDYNWINS